jgi:hypothetical protein
MSSDTPTISEMNYVIGVFDSRCFSGSHITDYTFENAPSMKYHYSWEWLLRAWRRWLGAADEYNDFLQYKDYHRIFHNCIDTNNMKQAHETLFEAIKWYQNKKQ